MILSAHSLDTPMIHDQAAQIVIDDAAGNRIIKIAIISRLPKNTPMAYDSKKLIMAMLTPVN